MRIGARLGHTLVELLVGLTLGTIVIALLTSACILQLHAAARVATLFEATDGLAAAASILDAETRDAYAADVSISNDSLAVRAFRGVALVCDTADGRAWVRYDGSRAPDPAKDSVLILRAGDEIAAAFSAPATAEPRCPALAGTDPRRLTVHADVRPGDLLLVFERGSYHLSGGALRWRVGAAGRQPLTAELFTEATGFVSAPRPGARLVPLPALRARPMDLPFRRPRP